jgi:hypothetical protein
MSRVDTQLSGLIALLDRSNAARVFQDIEKVLPAPFPF